MRKSTWLMALIVMPSVSIGCSTLEAIVLSSTHPTDVTLHWRSMGTGNFKSTAFARVARGVYSARIGAGQIKDDLEYYVTARSTGGQESTLPTTAPGINQTIVIMKEKLE